MTLKELYKVSPQAFIFVVERDDDFSKISSHEYHGHGPDGEREVFRVLPTKYPMYAHVLEVELDV